MTTPAEVRRTAEACVSFLRNQLDQDWTQPIPDLEMTVVEVVAHVAETCLWYAIDLAAAGAELRPVEHRVASDGDPADVLDTLATYTDIVAAVVEATPPSVRGFHPQGAADPSGFAAMTCDELLIHTDDAARGLGVDFDVAPDLAEPVLHRLFPRVSDVTDTWQQLQWANGRIEFAGAPRLSGWAWHCAPLDEWDGTIPTR